MSTKVKRKVTVENNKETDDQPRRPSVFERLGPGAVNMAPLPADRRNRQDHEDRCRNWERTGNCSYGNTCRYKHENFPVPSSSRRTSKPEKEMDKKDLRHKVRNKRDEPKEPRNASASPKKKGSKRSISRSRKGEHESKIKSTVVVTRPRSPGAPPEIAETKKKSEGNWEDDSDDWPMDAAQLDYKEELTLERKRQQLQRELELELQKERLLNENVTITKTVSFSGSSSSSSSSDSGSISSSSGSTSSSSEEDSNESTSSSSSSSSSSSRPSIKKKNKKAVAKVPISKKSSKGRVKDDYDKIKSSRALKSQKNRSPSPALEKLSRKKIRDKRNVSSVSPKRKKIDPRIESGNRTSLNVKVKGPRTPSPIQPARKQRQWAQSSSADSRSAEIQRTRNKRHKKKKDVPRTDKRKGDRGPPTPPHLSSPNRTALMPTMPSKKSKIRDESSGRKSRHHIKDSPPLLMPRNSNISQPTKLLSNTRYITEEKTLEPNRSADRGKGYSRKDDLLLPKQRHDSREGMVKRGRLSPRKESRKSSISPHKERYEPEVMPMISRKLYAQEKDKAERRRLSASPIRSDRRKQVIEIDKKRDMRDLSPRDHDPRRDNQYRNVEVHGYDKRGSETKVKRFVSPEGGKKPRDDRNRDYPQKERMLDYDNSSWQGEHRKTNASNIRRSPDSRSRQDMHSQSSLSRNDRSRDHDQDRKKRKDRDLSVRSVEDAERSRLSSPRRSQSPLHSHHGVREIEPLTDARGRLYEADVPPPVEREYSYSYEPLHDPYISDRLLPPEYETDVLRGPPLYPPDVYPESRYRRDVKEPLDRYGPRDVMSPRDILPHRDIIGLTGRSEDYLPDVSLDDRSYEDRWSRGRGREEWDPYASVPPAPLPPHVASALDEDRYGMPRRRRATPPDWQRNRMDDRESGGNLSHRPNNRNQLSNRDGRSRSPPPPTTKGQGSNRGSWNDRGGRHDSRNSDNRVHEDSQKNLDDRKGRNIKKDRIKRKEDTVEEKTPVNTKERIATKRPHSPSPAAKEPVKKRKVEVVAFDILKYHGQNQSFEKKRKKDKDESNAENKPAANKNPKPVKQEVAAPVTETSSVPDKEVAGKNTNDVKVKKKEERKSRKNDDATRGEDDFSDWSDDDLDLLTQDDFAVQEANDDNSKHRYRDENEDSTGSSKKRDKGSAREHSHDSKKSKDSNSRTSSKERSNDEAVSVKDHKQVSELKESDIQESLSIKEDTATDIDEYITAESVDYDPISDDELDALIEEPDDSLTKPVVENEKSKIVDALDVDWSALMKDSKSEFVPGNARSRFKAAHVLSRIGFSQSLAGSKLSEKIISICQKQLDEEDNTEAEQNDDSEKSSLKKNKFVMEHKLASFHVSIHQNKKERVNLFREVGPYRRALCARRDLQIRKMLCKPLNKFAAAPPVSYTPQYTVLDKELYKQSLELLKMKKSAGVPPQTVPVCS